MFGGHPLLSDTWEWDGTNWHDVGPAAPLGSPGQRTHHALVYDAARQRVVLFGGYDGTTQRTDTWTWDGATWTDVTPLVSPSLGSGTRLMAYDARRERVVLMAGPDLWEWDGSSWSQQTPIGPAPQRGAVLFYDPVSEKIILTPNYGETAMWEWDGTRWATRAPSLAPIRNFEMTAFDAAQRRLVVFDGTAAWTYSP